MRVHKGCDVKKSLCDILSMEGTCVLRRLNHIILSFSFLTMLGHYTSDLQLNERLACFSRKETSSLRQVADFIA